MLLRTQIIICGGTGCLSSKSNLIRDEFNKELKRLGLENEVQTIMTGCFGLCEKGPVVIVYPDEVFYSKVSVADVKPICEEHILKGRVYLPKAYKELTEDEKDKIKSFSQIGFYNRQLRIALHNCGVINPFDINEYIGRNGYEALGRVLTTMTPQDVIDIITKSGLIALICL